MDDVKHIPVLSVIIPAYNAASYLQQTVNSVIEENDRRVEIIVVDDGSTDETPEILAAFGNRIRSIRQSNQGLSSARNQGIAQARGIWIAFLDADDLWLPGFSTIMLAETDRLAEDYGVVSCGWQYVDTRGNKIGFSVTPSLADETFQRLLLGNSFPTMAAIVRQDWASRIGGFDLEIDGVQDWDFWLRLSQAGCKIHRIPHVLVSYRQVSGSMSRHVVMMRENGEAVLDKIYGKSDLPSDILHLKQKAYGFVKLWAAANYYNVGCPQQGFEAFQQSLSEFPVLLTMTETYYAIVCAEQPREQKGTAIGVNLMHAETLMRSLLHGTFAEASSFSCELRKASFALAYEVLSGFAFRQGNRRLAFRYALRSLMNAGDLKTLSRVGRLAAKAILLRAPNL